ncbi:MAG: hypothetical protein ACLQVD_07545, partial [Capsulimonadaceae bacterium]
TDRRYRSVIFGHIGKFFDDRVGSAAAIHGRLWTSFATTRSMPPHNGSRVARTGHGAKPCDTARNPDHTPSRLDILPLGGSYEVGKMPHIWGRDNNVAR